MPDIFPIDYSLVLPAYREEENLRIILPRLQETIRPLSGTFEIIVVDTVEPLDFTAVVCENYGARYVRRRPSNKFGDAVRTGIQEARGQWIMFMDADGSHAPEFIPCLIRETEQNDVVIASRYIEGGNTENAPVLMLMSRVLNFSYAVILNLKCKDVSNNFKIYRASLLKPLALKCLNFDIIEEMLYKINRRNPAVRIKEVPFSFKKRMIGKTKRNLFLFTLSYLITIIRLRLQK